MGAGRRLLIGTRFSTWFELATSWDPSSMVLQSVIAVRTVLSPRGSKIRSELRMELNYSQSWPAKEVEKKQRV